jgi:ankyrin repeat protein
MAAARSGKVDAAKRLLDAGADVNAKEGWGGQSAVMWAAAQGQADMIKLLASRGRRRERNWQGQSVGAKNSRRASSEGHEQGRLHAVAVCRARELHRMRQESDRCQGGSRISPTRMV